MFLAECGANAKLDASNNESVEFAFSKNTVLNQLVLGGFDYSSEEITITYDGITAAYLANDENITLASWDSSLKILTLPSPILIDKNAPIKISATDGQWGLSALVTEIQQ
mgnify:CR=1 FL=1